jgi:hypothetical protein
MARHRPLPTRRRSLPARHVVTGPDPLAGAQDLPGTSEVEGMDLAGMAVQRHGAAWLELHQLGPAVRSEAQRAERLARPGRDPCHAVGVQRPGRFECQVAHGFLRGVRHAHVTAAMAYHPGPICPCPFGPMGSPAFSTDRNIMCGQGRSASAAEKRPDRQLRPRAAAGPLCRLPCPSRTPDCASRTSRPPGRRPRPAAGWWCSAPRRSGLLPVNDRAAARPRPAAGGPGRGKSPAWPAGQHPASPPR